MTKEQLRNYRAIRGELTHLDKLAKRLEQHNTDELRAVYDKKRAKLSAELLSIEKAIDGLSPTERKLMRLRYIDGLSWQAVCTGINYSWQQTHRIHSKALIKLREV